MLELINEARENAGVMPVALGDNPAAQIHADNSLANCISSHWSMDGLDPDMRYSLAGGYQVALENVSGSDYCRSGSQGYAPIASLSNKVRAAMESWMQSRGHRETILRPRHRKVNIGLSWDAYNFKAVQQFEGDYVDYTVIPNITNGDLMLDGRTKNGANLEHGDHFRVIILYWQPQRLTQGQIARAYGSCNGRKVAHLSYKSSGTVKTTWKACLSPYDISPTLPAPSSAQEAHELWETAKQMYEAPQETVEITSRKIRMSRYQVDGNRFSIMADLSEVLAAHGPGVYTMVLFGVLDGQVTIISEHALFHGISQPVGYSGTSAVAP